MTNTTVPDSQSNQLITNPQIDTSNNRFSANQGYDYDSSGNVTKDATDKRFAYDAENKQTSFGTNGSSTNGGSYFYDGDGKRVKKVVGTETTIFVYNASGQMVAEYSTTAPPTIGTISYLTTDTLGSPRINTNASGQVTARHDYMPFGEEIIGLGNRTSTNGYQADNIRQKFTQKERDTETGLDFFFARYYSSAHGRFTSADQPFFDQHEDDPQSWNLYAYVGNNPLIYTDPFGLWKRADCSSGKCWEAEEGDTLTSLAKLIGVSAKHLTQFFSTDNPNNIQIGQVFDVSGFDHWVNVSAFAAVGIDVQCYDGCQKVESPSVPIPKERQPDIIEAEPHFLKRQARRFKDSALFGLSIAPTPGGAVTNALRLLGFAAKLSRGKGVLKVVGSSDDALMLFNALRGGNKVKMIAPGVWRADSASGAGKVTFRYVSKSGPPTVDVHGIEQGIRKIKFIQ
jgi:RHS repeat-associated protein